MKSDFIALISDESCELGQGKPQKRIQLFSNIKISEHSLLPGWLFVSLSICPLRPVFCPSSLSFYLTGHRYLKRCCMIQQDTTGMLWRLPGNNEQITGRCKWLWLSRSASVFLFNQCMQLLGIFWAVIMRSHFASITNIFRYSSYATLKRRQHKNIWKS